MSLSECNTLEQLIDVIDEAINNTELGSEARELFVSEVLKLDGGFDFVCWNVIHGEFRDNDDINKVALQKAIEGSSCLHDWLTIGGWTYDEHPECRNLVLRKLSDEELITNDHSGYSGFLCLIVDYLKEREYADSCFDTQRDIEGISADYEIVNLLELKIDEAVRQLEGNISYNEWVQYFHSEDDDIAILYLHKLSSLLEGDFVQWWTAYDLAEYNPQLRSFALEKLQEIKDIKSWNEVFAECDSKSNYGELYSTAFMILSDIDPDFIC